MRDPERGRWAAGRRGGIGRKGLALMLLGIAGCAGVAAPRGAVPMVAVAPQDPFGGWAAVWDDKGYSPTFEGELIAIGPDSVFVLVGDSLVGRSLAKVRRVRVVGYDPKASDLMEWTGLGMLSTASHGIVAFLSAPLWLILGGSIARGAAHASEFNAPGYHRTWNDLQAYARFPQGIPPGIDRAALRPRRNTKD